MKAVPQIHAFVLTLNEAQHIERCIASLVDQCVSITVIDSGSADDTASIARHAGAEVLINPFVNHASQVNFAIDALADRGGWLFRIDADEVLERCEGETLVDAVRAAPPDVNGLAVRRRIHFLGRRIRHGAIEPSWQLRLFRNGNGRCEQKWMDEHILVEGGIRKSGVIISDINLNSISWWIQKHNNYASREAIDALNSRYEFAPSGLRSAGSASGQARLRRFMKEKVYRRLPTSVRALSYFLYRYLLRLGFLDGREGLYFHTLQGFWYRFLVEAKITEIEKHARESGESVVDAIVSRTEIDPLK